MLLMDLQCSHSIWTTAQAAWGLTLQRGGGGLEAACHLHPVLALVGTPRPSAVHAVVFEVVPVLSPLIFAHQHLLCGEPTLCLPSFLLGASILAPIVWVLYVCGCYVTLNRQRQGVLDDL